VQLPSMVVDEFDLARPGLHTLRGPRQVGKSTDLKLLAQRALAEGRQTNQIIYLQADLMYGQPVSEFTATVEAAKRQARAGSGSLILLDEVTTLEGWDIGIKALWDLGPLRGDIVVATGSSSYDLYRGVAERWPGRRGVGKDHLVLPQSFAAFARAINNSVPKSPGLNIADLFSEEGRETLQEAQLHLPALEETFDLYLRFGGLPVAVAEAAEGKPEPSPETFDLVVDSVVREIHRRGASEAGTHALLERVARSLASRISWATVAAEMDIPLGSGGGRRGRTSGSTAPTVREYVELLSTCYFTAILYTWKDDLAGNALSREKKVYFSDPLFYGSTLRHSGLPIDRPALVENVLALALLRRYEPPYEQIRGFAEPIHLHLWRSKRGG
ncbi:MAG: AAA family ATPase, partial [Candidatus Dormibacteraceae bacterium]